MQILHISDTHGYHEELEISKCDVLIHSGDIGNRLTPAELMKFLVWFESQPADKKILVGGNHDICLDSKWVTTELLKGSVEGLLARQNWVDSHVLLKSYKIKYLMNTDYVYEGIKFYGSPYSPSFHRTRWVFNADRGQEIDRIWGKIPSDTNVLITHSPPYGVLDDVDEKYMHEGETDAHKGCMGLMCVIRRRLFNLKLHCFGHIHDRVGVITKAISNSRHLTFSNAAMCTNDGKRIIKKPVIISI